MPNNDALLTALVAAGVACLALGLFLAGRALRERRRRPLERRLSPTDSVETLSAESILLKDAGPRPPDSLLTKVDRSFGQMIERTGLGVSVEQALGLIGLAGVLLAGGLYLWRGELWLTFLGLLAGVGVPLVAFIYLQSRWRRQLQAQLPDAFFFLARSLRAGLSLEQALTLLGNEGLPPLAAELKRAAEQVRLGLTVPAALQIAARRIGLPDFNVFVSLVALHRTTGGNLTLLMDRLAAGVRDRNQYAGHFRSATALGRITAITIGVAVPLIFVGYCLFEPSYAQRFLESATGVSLLVTAFGLELIGAVWLYFLLKVDY
jgi:tight adherence protein B